jgi:hypothetical protein
MRIKAPKAVGRAAVYIFGGVLVVVVLLLDCMAWESEDGTASVDDETDDGIGAESVEDVDVPLLDGDNDSAGEGRVELDDSLLVIVSGGAAENDGMVFADGVDGNGVVAVASTDVLLVMDGGTSA